MPNSQPDLPQGLEKKEGTEKTKSKLDSPEAQAALAKKAGSQIIEGYENLVPNARNEWAEAAGEEPKDDAPKTRTEEGVRARENW